MINTTSKKGDIPITIFVIGVIVICFLAILSFYVTDKSVKNSFGDVGAVEKAALMGEKVRMYKESLGFSDSDLVALGVKQDPLGKYVEITGKNIVVRYSVP